MKSPSSEFTKLAIKFQDDPEFVAVVTFDDNNQVMSYDEFHKDEPIGNFITWCDMAKQKSKSIRN